MLLRLRTLLWSCIIGFLIVDLALWAKRPRNSGFDIDTGPPPPSSIVVNCLAGQCKEGFFVAYTGAYGLRQGPQFRPTVQPLSKRLIEFSSLVVGAYSGGSASGVYELQVDAFCLETLLGIWPPRPFNVQINLPSGAAKVNALTEKICGGKTEVVARGPDGPVLSRYEDMWKWRERKELLASIAAITAIPSILLAIILLTTFWFLTRVKQVKSGTARLLSAIEPLLVQLILLLILFPACFGFMLDPDDQGVAILLEVTLAGVCFAEFGSLGRLVWKRPYLHSLPTA